MDATTWFVFASARSRLACSRRLPHAYPYSNNRLIVFAAPGIGLMTGLGVSVALDSWRRRKKWVMAGLIVFLILPEIGFALLRLHSPWDQSDSAGTARFVKEQRQPGNLVATEGGTYTYFFFGEVRSLSDAARSARQIGQRVWVPIDHTIIENPRAAVLSAFSRPEWELHSETLFHRASVFLFVRRDGGMASQPDD